MQDKHEPAIPGKIAKWLTWTLLIASLAYILVEHYLHDYKVLARSRNIAIHAQPTITVREISGIVDDNPPYRFEYYCYSYPEIWSCQSYTGKSYKANSAQIEWLPDGSAVVSLDHLPIFKCKDGFWTAIH